jgi:hypothetical protein
MLDGMKSKLKSGVDRIMDYVLDQDAHNILRNMQRNALQDTSLFVEEHMFLTPPCRNKYILLGEALKKVTLNDGLYCEFGVHSGSTINFIASRVKGPVYGFDSFEGLPEDWRPGVEKGHFKMAALPKVRETVQLVKGWFNESLPKFLTEHQGPCAFVHVDCDLYSSTKTIFELMFDRIVPGTVLVFDEFFNYPRWRQGEFLAFQELLQAGALQSEYLGYVFNHEQVAVRITGKSASGG